MRCPPATAALRRRLSSSVLRLVPKRLRKPRAHDPPPPPPPPPLPYIPPEIWGVVVHHACLPDADPLDTARELSFLDSPATQLPAHHAAMRTKAALSLVCRAWHALAHPYLYEFVWISRAAQAARLARTLAAQAAASPDGATSARHLRRLHIHTPALERCDPADLRTILAHAPALAIYADRGSVRRGAAADPRASPEALLALLTHPHLRRLSWTSYDAVPFHLRMSPFRTNLATRLEFLELASPPPARASPAPAPPDPAMPVALPALRALKLSLDNATFAALASWAMPALRALSVLSSDFSYTGPGFAAFFAAHGPKLTQLELGHSSSLVEEHYLTAPAPLLPPPPPPALAAWCPRLREFICSADAEWHWRSPDWIAPHVLLPAHPTVQLIAVRDIDRRLADAAPPHFLLLAQMSSLLNAAAFPALRYVRDLSAESHRIRAARPAPPVRAFWDRVIDKCAERGVWLEDCHGVNITHRALQRAALACD